MSLVRLAVLLATAAAALYLAIVPPARREQAASEREYAQVHERAQQLRVRLATQRRWSGDEPGARASDGAAAVKALRSAVLRATQGIPVTGVEIAAGGKPRGAVAASARVRAEGRFADVLRVARRLAGPDSGLLLERVSLGATRDAVRLEAQAFILREAP